MVVGLSRKKKRLQSFLTNQENIMQIFIETTAVLFTSILGNE
jgi:hypothetical protein